MKEMKALVEMSFQELIEWSESDDSENATAGEWSEFKEQVEKKAPAFFFAKDLCQLNQFYREHPQDDIPYWFDAWNSAILDSHPFSDIYGRLFTIEKSLTLLLKEHENEPAKITIGQLNRLKNGL